MKSLMVAVFSSLLVLIPASLDAGQGRTKYITIETGSENGSWLGVSIQDMTPRLAKSMEVETKQGALVNDVIDDSPARKAGIKEEDIIIEFDGHEITDAEDLVDRVGDRNPDEEVSLVLMRGNERQSLLVTLAEPAEKHVVSFGHIPPIAPRVHVFMSHASLGIEVQELGDQLSEYFGAPRNEGVLVTEVDEESAAARAGLKAGDVILKVGSQTIRESDDIWDEVEEYEKGENIDLEILRDKSRETLTMEVEETPGRFWFKGPKSDMHFDFDHEFDDEWFEHFDKEIRWEQDRSRGKMERLRIHLNEIGEQIREWGHYLKEQFGEITRDS